MCSCETFLSQLLLVAVIIVEPCLKKIISLTSGTTHLKLAFLSLMNSIFKIAVPNPKSNYQIEFHPSSFCNMLDQSHFIKNIVNKTKAEQSLNC